MALALPTVSLLTATAAAAATPALVQSAGGQGSGTTSVAISVDLGSACTPGDTLIAMVTAGQLPGVGQVSAQPAGWQRLYEHSPTTSGSDPSPYQGWFALSDCRSGTQDLSFTVGFPGASSSTPASVVVDEFSGLPDPIAEDFAVNAGLPSATSGGVSGQSPSSNELVLTALSLYSSTPSAPTGGWTAGGSETAGNLDAYTYFQVTGSTASASYTWTPSSAYEATMLALKAGPSSPPAPDLVQQNQGAFSGQSSWGVSLPNGIASGDAVVALIGTSASQSGPGFEATSVSGGGVTWQQVTGAGNGGAGTAEMWVGFASSGTGGSPTITANFGSSVSGTMVVAEVSGVTSVDQATTNTGTSTGPSATISPQSSGEIALGFLSNNDGTVELHPTPNWSTLSVPASTYAGEWITNVPSGSLSPSWLVNPSSHWVTVLASLGNIPAVTGVSPDTGSTSGRSGIAITGVNFSGASAVDFGGTSASFTVNSPTSITAAAPSHSAGTVDVTVTTPSGTSNTSSADQFTYTSVPEPTVTAVSPATGPAGGGTSVAITGTNFTGAVGVDFGGTAAAGFTVNSSTSITATSPAGSGTVDVTVTTPSGVSATSAADQFTYTGGGYWMVGKDGGVFAFGTAPYLGSLPGIGVHVSDIVGVVPTADNKGYWMVGADGGVFAFGDATYLGSLPGIGVHVSDIVGVVPTHDGRGYWMVGADGGVFAFGDATFKGSLPGLGVKVGDIRAVVPTGDGNGYWMIGSDGGVFAFGDATYKGSLPGLGVKVSDVVGAVPTGDGNGYWMIGSDGGVFAFGDATYLGSLPGIGVHVSDIVGVVATPDNAGYWMVGSDGGVFAFGDATFVGSLPGIGVRVSDIVAVVPS